MTNLDSLEQYFSEKLLAPLSEREKESNTNKAFYMGEKSYEYFPTITGHEPTIDYPTNENCKRVD